MNNHRREIPGGLASPGPPFRPKIPPPQAKGLPRVRPTAEESWPHQALTDERQLTTGPQYDEPEIDTACEYYPSDLLGREGYGIPQFYPFLLLQGTFQIVESVREVLSTVYFQVFNQGVARVFLADQSPDLLNGQPMFEIVQNDRRVELILPPGRHRLGITAVSPFGNLQISVTVLDRDVRLRRTNV